LVFEFLFYFFSKNQPKSVKSVEEYNFNLFWHKIYANSQKKIIINFRSLIAILIDQASLVASNIVFFCKYFEIIYKKKKTLINVSKKCVIMSFFTNNKTSFYFLGHLKEIRDQYDQDLHIIIWHYASWILKKSSKQALNISQLRRIR